MTDPSIETGDIQAIRRSWEKAGRSSFAMDGNNMVHSCRVILGLCDRIARLEEERDKLRAEIKKGRDDA